MIAAVVNLSKFIEKTPINSNGKSYRHANPSKLNPPIPCLHASDIVVFVGLVKVILLISIPLVLAYCRRESQRWMSCCLSLAGVCDPYCFHCDSS